MTHPHPRSGSPPRLAIAAPGAYLPVLDGWRAVAILLVLLFHGFYFTNMTGWRYLGVIAFLTGRLGALGVLIFFCISGYLITGKLVAEAQTQGSFSGHDFYIKRFFRIVPPLAVYLLTVAVLGQAHVIHLMWGDWSAVVFLANYIWPSWYTIHFWSLSVEEHFYLFWPVCILLAGWRRALWIGIGLIVAVGIWRPWVLHHALVPGRTLERTDMRLDYIMMGCVVALAVGFYPWAGAALKRLGSAAWLAGLLLLLGALTLPLPFDPRSFQAAVLTLLVCASAHARSPLVHALLANRPMLFIGRISYSLYIWQQLFTGWFWDPRLRTPLALAVKMLCIFACALLSYYFVERPCIRWGRRYLRRPRNATSIPAPLTPPA